jgi:hypothetical protein
MYANVILKSISTNQNPPQKLSNYFAYSFKLLIVNLVLHTAYFATRVSQIEECRVNWSWRVEELIILVNYGA